MQESAAPAASAGSEPSPQVAFVGAVLMVGGAAVAPLAIRLARWIAPGRRVFFARWGFTHLTRVVIAFVLAQLALAWLWPVGAQAGLAGLLARSSLTFAAAGAVVVALARRVSPEGAAALGLRTGGNARAIMAGLLAYGLCLPGLLGAGFAWPWVLEGLGESWSPQPVYSMFLAAEGAELVFALVLAVLVQPFLEELLFRGFLQPLLVQNLHDRAGIALTSLIFASLHGADAFLPVFLLSLILGGVMLRTQRLAAAWCVHAAHNGLMLAVALGSDAWRELLQP